MPHRSRQSLLGRFSSPNINFSLASHSHASCEDNCEVSYFIMCLCYCHLLSMCFQQVVKHSPFFSPLKLLIISVVQVRGWRHCLEQSCNNVRQEWNSGVSDPVPSSWGLICGWVASLGVNFLSSATPLPLLCDIIFSSVHGHLSWWSSSPGQKPLDFLNYVDE